MGKEMKDSTLNWASGIFSLIGAGAAFSREFAAGMCCFALTSFINLMRLSNERKRKVEEGKTQEFVDAALDRAAKTFEKEPHDSLCDLGKRVLCPHEVAKMIRVGMSQDLDVERKGKEA